MRLWHLPASPLPVVTRPRAGETLPSYARRLAAANDLTPYAILRALGHLRTGPGKHLLVCDARINEHAAARLEAYTGIPRERLARAMPAMTRQIHPGDTLPPDRPALCFLRMQTRPPCRKCELAATSPSGPAALVLPGWTPLRLPPPPALARPRARHGPARPARSPRRPRRRPPPRRAPGPQRRPRLDLEGVPDRLEHHPRLG